MASNEEPVLEEATQRIRTVENRMLAAGVRDQPTYGNLFARVSGAPVM